MSSGPEPLEQPVPSPAAPPDARAPAKHGPPENLLLNLVCNVVLPTLILSKFSGPHTLGPRLGLIIALAFPLGYGLHDFVRRRKANFISIIGVVSVLISGSFGLLNLDGFWFAVKDAAIPGLIGLSVLVSMRSSSPLVESILYNPQIIDVDRVDQVLAERAAGVEFKQLMKSSSYLLAASFFISAVLNYVLARHLLRSAPGTEAFNAELGKMHLWSWPVIVVPSMIMMMFALWRLMHGIKVLTGLELEAVLKGPPEKK